MGKAGKKRKHDEKMKLKRAAKAAKKAAYAAMAGTSKKAKRQTHRKKKPSVLKGSHAMADCGNVGCKQCYPHLNRRRIAHAA